jgi:hypothetical protein
MSMSMSLSLPEEEFVTYSMSMPDDVEFEQFGVEFGSMSASMSMPLVEETEFAEYEVEETGVSMSLSMPAVEDAAFEQFGADFSSLSMSIPEEEFAFDNVYSVSMSMSMPAQEADFEQFGADLGSLSMSIPEEEFAFEDIESSISMSMPVLPEPDLQQFENGFGESEPKETASDDFFFMPIFDDRTDVVEPEVDEDVVASISMSLPVEDLDQWAVEEGFDFLTNEFSVSMSMSMA